MPFLAVLAVVVLSAVMPQMVRSLTGKSADSRAITEGWRDFPHRLAEALAPAGGGK